MLGFQECGDLASDCVRARARARARARERERERERERVIDDVGKRERERSILGNKTKKETNTRNRQH